VGRRSGLDQPSLAREDDGLDPHYLVFIAIFAVGLHALRAEQGIEAAARNVAMPASA
jgi:hypothetical protein